MKTTILLRVGVASYLLAGVAGCGSKSEAERPAAFDPGAHVESPPLAGSADQSTVAPATAVESPERNQGAIAKPDSPRIGKFAELDTDQDGQLSLAEFSGSRKDKDAKKWFERRDVDRDGFLSLGEFVPTSAPRAGSKTPASDKKNGEDSPAVDTQSQPIEGK